MRLLDLFCGAGGAGVGYARAGFQVTGVDLKMRRGYPFPRVQADALQFVADSGHRFDAIHASPPCQAYSAATPDHCRADHPDLVGPVREALKTTGRPWVIENVPGAPLRVDLKLCGCMFGLPRLRRERWFETSWHAFDLRPPCYHPEPTISVISGGRQSGETWAPNRHHELMPIRAAAMGIDWIPLDHQGRTDLALAIPPAYTEYIGRQLMEVLAGK